MNTKVITIGLFAITVIALFAANQFQTFAIPPYNPNIVEPPSATLSRDELGNLIARLVVSGVLLIAALYVILTKKYKPEDKNWAYGALGTIAGFWLRA